MTETSYVHRVDPLIQDLGYRYYFAPETGARAKELGLDLFQFYFLGRAGVLGDVEGSVVAAAFGYFNPDVVTAMWDAGRATLAPRDAGRAHLACCAAFGRKHLTDLDCLEELCDALQEVNDAASRRLATLSVYAGLLAEPIPEDAPARAMHLVALLREHRAGVHLTAVVAAGVDPVVAHLLRRPDMWRMFGWRDEHKPTVTDLDRRRLAEVDATTDRLVAPFYDVLDGDRQQAVLRALTAARDRVGSEGQLPV